MNGEQIRGSVPSKQVAACPQSAKVLTIVLLALVVTCLFSYWSIMWSNWLLDEKFLLGFLQDKNNHYNFFQTLFSLSPDNLSGCSSLSIFSLIVSSKFCGHSVFLWRFKSLCFHIASTLLVFFVVKRLPIDKSFLLATASAFLFALYPLHAEAVFWLPGRDFEIATMFFLASFYCYLRAKSFHFLNLSPKTNPTSYELTIDWRFLSGSLALYLLALLSAGSFWVGCLFVAAFEATNAICAYDNRDKQSILRSAISFGPFLVVTLIALALLSWQGNFPALSALVAFKNWYHIFLNLFLPIDRLAGAHYSRDILYLIIILVLPLLAFAYTLTKNKDIRYISLLSLLWLFVTPLPYLGQAVYDYTLSGERALYLTSFAVSLLMAAVITSFAYLSERLDQPLNKIGRVVALIFLLLLAGFYLGQLSQQLQFYKRQGKAAEALQKSLQTIVAKNNVDYVFALNVSHDIAISQAVKAILNQGVFIALDSKSGLLAAPQIPDGELKDALASGKFVNCTFAWDKDSEGFQYLDLSPKDNQFGTDLNGVQIAAKLMPPMQYYPNVSLNSNDKTLVMESNSANGPVIRLDGNGLGPLAGDFFYVDARIQAPINEKPPEIELYWTTRALTNYDHKLRRAAASAVVNDGKYHRYYLPLRSSGFFANGPIAALMLGFPAGAKVELLAVGITNGAKCMPKLTLPPQAACSKLYVSPFSHYPNIAELGMMQISRAQGATLAYDLSNIEGATKGTVEISKVNEGFSNPNGDKLSDQLFTTIEVPGAQGSFTCPLTDLKANGVYSLRIIGKDNNGHFAGNFSDAINLLVGP
jgi:hypothetical protein